MLTYVSRHSLAVVVLSCWIASCGDSASDTNPQGDTGGTNPGASGSASAGLGSGGASLGGTGSGGVGTAPSPGGGTAGMAGTATHGGGAGTGGGAADGSSGRDTGAGSEGGGSGGRSGASGGSGNGGNGGNGGADSGGSGSATRAGSGGAFGGGRGGGAGAPNGGVASAGSGQAGAGPTGGNVTVWLAGDSTVANGNTPCPTGWGASFREYFDSRVTVTNSAVGGRSVRTWLYDVQTTMDGAGECNLQKDASGMPVLQARWQAMLTGMKAGDYLFVQFGINDSSATCDRHVGLAAFRESYRMMAKAAKERGAQPIFVTPVSAIACNGSTPRATRGDYVTATRDAGMAEGVPVIDLHALSIALYTSSGFCPIPGGDVSASTTGPVGDFFCDDHTHFSPSGAKRIAGLVAEALRTQSLGLAAYLK